MVDAKTILLYAMVIVFVVAVGAYVGQSEKIKAKEQIISTLEKDLKSFDIGGVEGILINAPQGASNMQFSVRNPTESDTTFWYVFDFWPSTGSVDVQISGGLYAIIGGPIIDTRQKINRKISVSDSKQLIIIRDDFNSSPGEGFHEVHDIDIDMEAFPLEAINKSPVHVSFYQSSEPPEGLYSSRNLNSYTVIQ